MKYAQFSFELDLRGKYIQKVDKEESHILRFRLFLLANFHTNFFNK